MAKAKVVMNSAGARSILNGPEVMADLLSRGQAITSACGEHYNCDVREGRTRAHCLVKTDGAAGARDNAKNNTILRNLDAGR